MYIFPIICWLQRLPCHGKNPRGMNCSRLTRLPRNNIRESLRHPWPVSKSRQTVLARNTKAHPATRGLPTTTALYPRNRSSLNSRRDPVPGPTRAEQKNRTMALFWRMARTHPDALATSSWDTVSSRGYWALWCSLRLTSRRTQVTRCALWCLRFW